MSIYFDGTNDYASYAGSLGSTTGHPLTICAWVYRMDLTASSDTLVQYGVGGGVDTESVQIRSTNTGQAAAWAYDASVQSIAATTETALESAWHHYAGVFAATNSRTAYLDGNASTTNTGNRTFSNPFDELIVGNNFVSSVDFKGYLAHVAIWNVALSAGDIGSLASGADPQTISAANLVAYYPMTNASSPGEDVVGSYDLTLFGNSVYDALTPTISAPSTKRIVPVNFIRAQASTVAGS